MKIAVSIADDVFKEVEDYVKQSHRSRSELVAEALREYMTRVKSKEILDSLNEVYSDEDTEEEKAVKEKAKRRFSAIVREGER
jgi:metal-responsive CopG/Arc/MetJ family transcriptional regulator